MGSKQYLGPFDFTPLSTGVAYRGNFVAQPIGCRRPSQRCNRTHPKYERTRMRLGGSYDRSGLVEQDRVGDLGSHFRQ